MSKFEYKKKFGQNFISDKNLIKSIVIAAGVEETDTVVEVGAGMGSLTEQLSASAKKVVSFEIDTELENVLKNKFDGTNVEVIFRDVMELSAEEINNFAGDKFKLVANLPYYVTSPVLTKFLKNPNMVSATIMVQAEVAERITAKPHTGDYGLLSVICQLFGTAKIVKKVGRENFYPVPNVDSAVVRIDKNNDLPCDFEEVISFAKRAFSMKRKKLSTNLASDKMTKSQIEEELEKLGINPLARAEELSTSDFCKLCEHFRGKI